MKRNPGLFVTVVGVCLSWWTPAHADVITDWNAVTLSCVQGPPAPPNRPGPAGLLDIALVQLAVHDANAGSPAYVCSGSAMFTR